MVPKWSEAFCEAIWRETGSRAFTYVIAVTRLSGERTEWENHMGFRRALRGNPIRLMPLAEMAKELLPGITTTPSSSAMGRTLQLLKASGFLQDVASE